MSKNKKPQARKIHTLIRAEELEDKDLDIILEHINKLIDYAQENKQKQNNSKRLK